jgi:hypothetical protein
MKISKMNWEQMMLLLEGVRNAAIVACSLMLVAIAYYASSMAHDLNEIKLVYLRMELRYSATDTPSQQPLADPDNRHIVTDMLEEAQ